jgi:hypothetical protein
MKKFLRILFVLITLVTCFQFIGLEEAFCEDSVMQAGCQDCVTCVSHQFTGIANSVSLPVITFSSYTFLNYLFQPIENLPSGLFRPPIAR